VTPPVLLDLDDVLRIQRKSLEKFGGLRDQGLLRRLAAGD
jgi:hypothetical protein